MVTAERETNAEPPEEKRADRSTPLPSDRLSSISRRVTALELEEREHSSPWSRDSLLASLAVSAVSSLILGLLYLAWKMVNPRSANT